MNIQLSKGVGSGPTKLSAFDAALNDAGIANYNLIKLSSVVPPGAVIERRPVKANPHGTWGDRLYVVMAEMRVDTPNAEAWAGIGWVQEKGSGRGLFVEHEGASEATVRKDIKQSLKALMAIRNVDFGLVQMEVVGAICVHMPICALVVAVFESAGWKSRVEDFNEQSPHA